MSDISVSIQLSPTQGQAYLRWLVNQYEQAMADHDLIQWGVTQQAIRALQDLATTWEQFGQ